ncbi:2-succinyl-6-hydroxy-2,4-cyclohexadiene-1-carboxylate synthase [Lentibacillus saliphilus]|uniref:2-succinyl-6-hydroxy-2, 4-cyclohexadiene-1-carboxylate synthase n=1 Tax=Lentibacillus saliphilus TaxID=2737028 RepID=UPI001C308440|nr:2-succinyl-6-hydroxy-2,4-cyclohexadiene-1-carboxylate synthase [Lentibacillus saliphilus]
MYFKIGQDAYWYDIHGDKGPTIVMLHGFTGTTKTWTHILPYVQSGYNVVLIDLPGHGKTNTGPKTMAACCTDLNRLFRHLQLDRIHLVGYSMGGRTALSYAVAYPDMIETLILESASPGLEHQAERLDRIERDEQLATRIETEGIESFVDFWEGIPLFASQKRLISSVQTALREERLSQTEIGLAHSLRGMGTGAQTSLWQELSTVTCPVLLLVGSLDHKFIQINQTMVEHLPNSHFEMIDDVGHAIHVEVPHIFGKMVYNFIKQNNI